VPPGLASTGLSEKSRGGLESQERGSWVRMEPVMERGSFAGRAEHLTSQWGGREDQRNRRIDIQEATDPYKIPIKKEKNKGDENQPNE